jgi:hypothetical protein
VTCIVTWTEFIAAHACIGMRHVTDVAIATLLLTAISCH